MTDLGVHEILVDLMTEPAGVPRARGMMARAEWAARSFRTYDKRALDRILDSVAIAGAENAARYAEWAVAETGFGVVEHKILKNLACSTGLIEAYRDHDYVTPRFDSSSKIVEVPRPAGVVLALTPSTNPVATVYFNCLLALMTRSVVIVSPHPMAREVCADAARMLSKAATTAGAPDGVIQVVDKPSVPLIGALMTDPRTDVIVATGGSAVVRSAYSSGTPAIGVGPGNVPVFVDATADLAAAAVCIIDSKSFDNSILCTNESVLIVHDLIAQQLLRHMKMSGAYPLQDDERDRVRGLLFPNGNFDVAWVGKSASAIAEAAEVRVPAHTKILLAPFDYVVPEEPLAHEKLCPVLGLVRVPSTARGIEAARSVLRIAGRGHSASIHCNDAAVVMNFGAAVDVLRVTVNVGNSLGASGIATNLPPSMTIGTGYVGRSSVGENLQPKHLVQWTRLAYNSDAAIEFPSFFGLDPWKSPEGPIPPYPLASNSYQAGRPFAKDPSPVSRREPLSMESVAAREEIRRLVAEELERYVKG